MALTDQLQLARQQSLTLEQPWALSRPETAMTTSQTDLKVWYPVLAKKQAQDAASEDRKLPDCSQEKHFKSRDPSLQSREQEDFSLVTLAGLSEEP